MEQSYDLRKLKICNPYTLFTCGNAKLGYGTELRPAETWFSHYRENRKTPGHKLERTGYGVWNMEH